MKQASPKIKSMAKFMTPYKDEEQEVSLNKGIFYNVFTFYLCSV